MERRVHNRNEPKSGTEDLSTSIPIKIFPAYSSFIVMMPLHSGRTTDKGQNIRQLEHLPYFIHTSSYSVLVFVWQKAAER